MTIETIEGNVCAPKGFAASSVEAGFKTQGKDLALIYSKKLCATASVYTKNKVKGAPLIVTKEHSANGKAQAIIINSGNANTCNANGEEIARAVCELVAESLKIIPQDVLVASTGVIGQPLDIAPFQNNMAYLSSQLSSAGGSLAAEAILTTDTVKKEKAVTFQLDNSEVTIGGMAKGSGMIHPNMATMLGFLTTDVSIDSSLLHEVLKEVVEDTFNMLSVDGDTSTNDMVTILANGEAGNEKITSKKDPNYLLFKQALAEVCEYLAIAIAKDGEGASTLLTCTVWEAMTKEQAKAIAKSIITSNLVKAAVYGRDPNVGRLLCAVGNSETDVDWQKIDIYLRSEGYPRLCVCQAGSVVLFDEDKAVDILKNNSLFIDVYVHAGEGQATAWGCDLTYDYIKINADYRT